MDMNNNISWACVINFCHQRQVRRFSVKLAPIQSNAVIYSGVCRRKPRIKKKKQYWALNLSPPSDPRFLCDTKEQEE